MNCTQTIFDTLNALTWPGAVAIVAVAAAGAASVWAFFWSMTR